MARHAARDRGPYGCGRRSSGHHRVLGGQARRPGNRPAAAPSLPARCAPAGRRTTSPARDSDRPCGPRHRRAPGGGRAGLDHRHAPPSPPPRRGPRRRPAVEKPAPRRTPVGSSAASPLSAPRRRPRGRMRNAVGRREMGRAMGREGGRLSVLRQYAWTIRTTPKASAAASMRAGGRAAGFAAGAARQGFLTQNGVKHEQALAPPACACARKRASIAAETTSGLRKLADYRGPLARHRRVAPGTGRPRAAGAGREKHRVGQAAFETLLTASRRSGRRRRRGGAEAAARGAGRAQLGPHAGDVELAQNRPGNCRAHQRLTNLLADKDHEIAVEFKNGKSRPADRRRRPAGRPRPPHYRRLRGAQLRPRQLSVRERLKRIGTTPGRSRASCAAWSRATAATAPRPPRNSSRRMALGERAAAAEVDAAGGSVFSWPRTETVRWNGA